MKNISFTDQALKFLNEQSYEVRTAFEQAVNELITEGRLHSPKAKVIAPNLYEIRVKDSHNQYRLFYCYFNPDGVLVLSGFVKKTQKTPPQEIRKAKKIRKETLGV